MRTQIAAALLALAAPLQAIKITSPAKNDVVDPAAGVTIKWTTVSTDPSRANLLLVNMASGHTPYSKDLGEIDLSKGSITVTQKDVPDDEAYQFNFESVEENNTGILAQSEQFEVKAGEKSTDEASTSSASSTATTAKSAVTSAATNSATGSSTASTASTLTTVSSSATGSATTTATRTASSSLSTGAAAPTGLAVQGVLALAVGVAAVLA
jgi:hypothetical protein